jgi:predicted unusual protein kinase regulating ubiquinone biosynthesis (AarF/ABC1/UbiB family)
LIDAVYIVLSFLLCLNFFLLPPLPLPSLPAGNILVRFRDAPGIGPSSPFSYLLSRLRALLGLPADPPRTPHLVLLDVGMIAELTYKDRTNLLKFFTSLTKLDGKAIGESMLGFSDQQTCPNPAAFVQEVRERRLNNI